MSFCECALDAEEVIEELAFKAAMRESDEKCWDCGDLIPAGEPFVLYEGFMEVDPDEDDGLEPDWNMISCRLCHRMRQDLESMGYCVLYPGLGELIERMEDESDLKDLAERRTNSDIAAGLARRFKRRRPGTRTVFIQTACSAHYSHQINHLEAVPPWRTMRQMELIRKAKAMAEFWRKRAAWEGCGLFGSYG